MNNDVHRDEKIRFLQSAARNWYDVTERRLVRAATVFVAFGCPDWGNPKGIRNNTCTFCALPQAAEAYRTEFYGDAPILDHVDVFEATLRSVMAREPYHTLNIFNAGSFLAMPDDVQIGVVRCVVQYRSIKRLVVEARASLVTKEKLRPILDLLAPAGIALTVRIGVETQDDHLRLRVLRKGHTRARLQTAVEIMRECGVCSGAYALLNPAPGLDPQWAEEESLKTFDWVLGELGMDEAYFGPTCVGPKTSLADDWRAGRFAPPTLWSVYNVLTTSLARHGTRVHLLRFADEPPFIAVPSNHVAHGIPESLEGAEGCDHAFHSMLDQYRDTMDPSVLHPIQCSCTPASMRL
jgi:radical SAM enzyme (TIGR01210 family)